MGKIGMVLMRSLAELEAGLAEVAESPSDTGHLDLIVRRPAVGAREVLDSADLSTEVGLVGDTWHLRPSSRSEDGRAHPDMQVNIMNTRVADLVAGDRSRWPLAGDQLFVDLDLSVANLPAGTRLAIGREAILEVTVQPHTGCGKFAERFGLDALKFVNGAPYRRLRLRGLNARVVQGGTIHRGDPVRVLRGDRASTD